MKFGIVLKLLTLELVVICPKAAPLMIESHWSRVMGDKTEKNIQTGGISVAYPPGSDVEILRGYK